MMFEQLPAPAHVLALRFSGKITGEDIKGYKSVLEGMLQKHDRIGACCDLSGLADLSADAMVEGLKADLEFLTHISQFSRCALISDTEWPRALISLVAPLLPTFEMQVFTPEQSDEAMQWTAELPEMHEAETPAIRIIPTSKDDVFAFEINGVISSAEFPGFLDHINAFLDRHDKVRLLGRIQHLGGFDPAIFMQSGLVSMKLAAMQKVERYAIVGAPGWMHKWAVK
jgi:hypothetical protein